MGASIELSTWTAPHNLESKDTVLACIDDFEDCKENIMNWISAALKYHEDCMSVLEKITEENRKNQKSLYEHRIKNQTLTKHSGVYQLHCAYQRKLEHHASMAKLPKFPKAEMLRERFSKALTDPDMSSKGLGFEHEFDVIPISLINDVRTLSEKIQAAKIHDKIAVEATGMIIPQARSAVGEIKNKGIEGSAMPEPPNLSHISILRLGGTLYVLSMSKETEESMLTIRNILQTEEIVRLDVGKW